MAVIWRGVPPVTAHAGGDSTGDGGARVPTDDEFLTVSDVAERVRVHPQTVRGWIARSELPAIKDWTNPPHPALGVRRAAGALADREDDPHPTRDGAEPFGAAIRITCAGVATHPPLLAVCHTRRCTRAERSSMKRSPLRRRSKLRARKQLQRRTSLQRSPAMAATESQRAAVAGRTCIVCGTDRRIDPMHVIPRSLGGCGDRLCVVPGCRGCHRAYDRGDLDLLPYLEPAWRAQVAHAVGHVGPIGALRRISGGRQTGRALGEL